VYKELWKHLYTTLTEEYGLHNLIWEYNSYNYSNSHTWYPGDEYVDIVAYDKYNVDYNRGDGLTSGPNFNAISAIFNYIYNLVDGGKMIAMSENDTVPTVENLIVEDAGWLYFCPWYTDHLMSDRYQDPEALAAVYQSDYCITLDELPEDLYEFDGATTPTEPEKTTEPVTADPDIMYGDVNDTGDIEIADAILIMSNVVNSELYPLTADQADRADVYQKGDGIGINDAVSVQKYITKLIGELPESYM